jgi:hypothetical protein
VSILVIDKIKPKNDAFQGVIDPSNIDSQGSAAGQVIMSQGSGLPPIWANVSGGGSGDIYFEHVEIHALDASDISNKYITLAAVPINPTTIICDIVDGPPAEAVVDFNVINSNRLSWQGCALDGQLSVGDQLRVEYQALT